jgi:hypothetical protein
MRSIEAIKEIFKDLSDGVRIVLLIHRSKEGGFNNTHKRHLKKIITNNSQEFFETILEFQEFIKQDGRPLRIYSSLNNRDFGKAIRMYKHLQIERDYDSEELRNKFYLNTKNNFIGCLMNNNCKISKNFLFDLDDCDDRSFHSIYNILEKLTEIIVYYPTKNGYHIITKPFNYKALDDNIVSILHKDSLMLIDY